MHRQQRNLPLCKAICRPLGAQKISVKPYRSGIASGLHNKGWMEKCLFQCRFQVHHFRMLQNVKPPLARQADFTALIVFKDQSLKQELALGFSQRSYNRICRGRSAHFGEFGFDFGGEAFEFAFPHFGDPLFVTGTDGENVERLGEGEVEVEADHFAVLLNLGAGADYFRASFFVGDGGGVVE